ncbi:hypothetical protein M0R45_025217 [Rubus argutus]|uniref:Uncharacterized protein n=1 Tax=Rubus argutus TaxID=59490 RepID=A0AAW1WWN3_RUBAR
MSSLLAACLIPIQIDTVIPAIMVLTVAGALYPPYLTVINSSIQAQRGISRMADCDDYAFLVDKQWFDLDYDKTNFRAVKKMDSIPVVLDWSLSSDNNKSLFKLYKGFAAHPIKEEFERLDTVLPWMRGLEMTMMLKKRKDLCFLGWPSCSHPIAHERPKSQTILQIISGSVPVPRVSLFKPAFVWPNMPEGQSSIADQ